MDASDSGQLDSGQLDSGQLDSGQLDSGQLDSETPDATGELWFEEIAAASGVDFVQVPATDTVASRMAGGVCAIDVDGVAPTDLFFANQPSMEGGASRLYVGNARLRYEDGTTAAGLAGVAASACLAFDEDGDGDDDLLVSGMGGPRLFENRGGVFEEVSDRFRMEVSEFDLFVSAAAGDVDGDGDVDLLVVGYRRLTPGVCSPLRTFPALDCAVDITAFPAIADLLLIRQDDGSYVDRAPGLAPSLRLAEPGLVAGIVDLDNDGDPELFIGNDLGVRFPNRVLSRGADGVFVDVGAELGLERNRHGYGIDAMGWARGDIDGDGHLDVVVSSFEGDATSVFMCDAVGVCEEKADEVGTLMLTDLMRWATALVDLDLDGDLELFEVTGHYYTDSELPLVGLGSMSRQAPSLMVNAGDGTLRAWVPEPRDGLSEARVGRGLAVLDLDDDGRLDLVVAPSRGRPALLHNVRETEGHHLAVRLVGSPGNVDALGARVLLRAAGRSYLRERNLGEGYAGNFGRRVHFGVPVEGPVVLEVTWPGGARSTHEDVALDGAITLLAPVD